jgi:fumarate reductase flavoprotein subunit
MCPSKPKQAGEKISDILIVGGGGAGLIAAITAVENGCKNVTVLEKMSAPGGNSAIGGGIFAAESPTEKREGVNALRDDYFKLATSWAHWKNDARIVRAYINKSGDTVRWLEEKGFRFPLNKLYPGQRLPVWHGLSGLELLKTLSKCCQDMGITILVKTRAKKLVLDEKGGISGVLVEKDGQEYTINTKSVIIASGGYGANKRLMKKYISVFNDNMSYVGVRQNTGDGLNMAIDAGAAVENPGTMVLDGPTTPISSVLSLPIEGMPPIKGVVGKLMRTLGMVAKTYRVIWVNKNGRRFIDESACPIDMASANAVVRQPEGICYALFDDKIRQIMEEKGLSDGLGLNFGPPRGLPGLEKELRRHEAEGVIKISGSWDEIAQWMGADPTVLKTEINEYNDACDRGYDPVFVKDPRYLLSLRTPPYYALKCQTILMDTIGGIKINEKMEVLDRSYHPIPGLFAAGSCAGGLQGDLYNYDLPGSAQGFALNSGRIAGENAFTFVSR